MIKRFILFLIILSIISIILILKNPDIARYIEKNLQITWIVDFVINSKEKLNWGSTYINVDNIDSVASWALELKNNIIEWWEYIRNWVDTIRDTLSWSYESYTEVKDKIEYLRKKLDENAWMINDIRDTIDSFSWVTNEVLNQ